MDLSWLSIGKIEVIWFTTGFCLSILLCLILAVVKGKRKKRRPASLSPLRTRVWAWNESLLRIYKELRELNNQFDIIYDELGVIENGK